LLLSLIGIIVDSDNEKQVALPSDVAGQLERAFIAQKWFAEVCNDFELLLLFLLFILLCVCVCVCVQIDSSEAKEKTVVKLFAADDARMFVRDDKEVSARECCFFRMIDFCIVTFCVV
jgi:hypothetical protein